MPQRGFIFGAEDDPLPEVLQDGFGHGLVIAQCMNQRGHALHRNNADGARAVEALEKKGFKVLTQYTKDIRPYLPESVL